MKSPISPQLAKYMPCGVFCNVLEKIKSKDKTALDVFVRKYTGVDHVKWLDEVQAQKIIEILKQMIAR